MLASNIVEILEKHQLRKTKIRLEILQLFGQKQYALSQNDIEENLQNFDRVTVYRTLKSFEEQGIIHRIIDEAGISKFAVCANCQVHHHHDRHIHLSCVQCGNTFCLDQSIPPIQAPKGYTFLEYTLLAKGICINCKEN